jgi:hypothetical protein
MRNAHKGLSAFSLMPEERLRSVFSHITLQDALVGLRQIDQDQSIQDITEPGIYVEPQQLPAQLQVVFQ